MTTIAAVQGDGWAVVGADSQVSEENKKFRLPGAFSKIFQNGPYLMAVAGDLRAVNILTHNFRPPNPGKATGEALDRFIATRFITRLRLAFESNSYKQEGDQASSLVLAVKGVIYEIGADYDFIRESNGIYSIGTGSSYALGALHVLDRQGSRTLASAKEQVRAALLAGCSYDSYSSEPITIVVQGS
jgi:ATP-dependent protease HslVU (ClpYQ) peptidase subunit